MVDNVPQLKELFRKWIVMQGTDYYGLSENDRGDVELQTDYATGYVNFYDDIVELRIETIREKETVFFLHFQFQNLERAEELFNEMKGVLIHLKDKQGTKVVLCCTSGLTTSYFSELLNKAAQGMNFDFSFKAVNFQKVYEEGQGCDAILLAPQIAYERKKIQDVLKGALVMNIPPKIFATYNCGALIELLRSELARIKEERTPNVERALRFSETSKKILTIGVINNFDRIKIIYKYYQNGHQVTHGESIKSKIVYDDIADVIDFVIKDYPEIEAIGVGMPGTVEHGKLFWKDFQTGWVDVQQKLRDRYHRSVYLFNDANMIVTGIYWMEDKYRSLMLYFEPGGMYTAGCGIVVNGHLIHGKKDIAGEAQYVQKTLSLSRPPQELIRNPEGSEELMVKTLVPMISTVGPEAVFIYNQMTPDMDQVKDDMKRYIPEEYLPDFIYLEEITEYMLTGIFFRTIWKMQDDEHSKEGFKTLIDKDTGEIYKQ